MSIMKNPIFLALLASAVVFAVTYYYYNHYCQPKVDKKGDKKKGKKSEKATEINENMIVGSAIAGLVTWYVASSYFADDSKTSSKNSDDLQLGSQDGEQLRTLPDTSDKFQIIDTQNPKGSAMSSNANVGALNSTNVSNSQKGGSFVRKVPSLASDDSTRSYNLIGSGVNIPRSDLKIPSVLIDYK